MKTHAHYIAPLCARGEPFEPRPTCTYDEDETDILPAENTTAPTQNPSMQLILIPNFYNKAHCHNPLSQLYLLCICLR